MKNIDLHRRVQSSRECVNKADVSAIFRLLRHPQRFPPVRASIHTCSTITLIVQTNSVAARDIMPKATKISKNRHDPLHVELEQDETIRKFGRSKSAKRKSEAGDNEDGVNDVS